MKLKDKLAKEYTDESGVSTDAQAYIAGFDRAIELAAREAVFTGLACTNLDTIIEQIGEEEVG